MSTGRQQLTSQEILTFQVCFLVFLVLGGEKRKKKWIPSNVARKQQLKHF